MVGGKWAQNDAWHATPPPLKELLPLHCPKTRISASDMGGLSSGLRSWSLRMCPLAATATLRRLAAKRSEAEPIPSGSLGSHGPEAVPAALGGWLLLNKVSPAKTHPHCSPSRMLRRQRLVVEGSVKTPRGCCCTVRAPYLHRGNYLWSTTGAPPQDAPTQTAHRTPEKLS